MAGIYIHIPFCRQACHYCNFHFTTSLHYKNEMIAALLKEISLISCPSPQVEKGEAEPERIETIYYGGGTPSLLDAGEIRSILYAIRKKFNVTKNAEITLEANPDDITREKLMGWKNAGINRLSIGIQSFFDEDLRWMNRAHTAKEATDHLQLAKNYFDNITIDLIYGMPSLSNEKWKQNVDMAISMKIPHLSCYALTVEKKTALDKMIRLQQVENTDPEKQSEQFLLLMQWMEDAGYEHYEISNFAKPGWRSLHNSSYWQGKKYWGIGPSAHSFDGNCRQWNVSNNQQYMESVQRGIIPFEKEVLTEQQRLNEYIMTSLRTMEGLNLENTGEATDKLLHASKKYIESGLMKLTDQHLILTREGKLLADGIAGALFI